MAATLHSHVGVQITKEELVASLRQQSKGATRTSSQFRGVTRHQKGKWEARVGQVPNTFALTMLKQKVPKQMSIVPPEGQVGGPRRPCAMCK